MNKEFKREERYIVFKVSDLGNSLKGDEIRKLAREYAEHRKRQSKKPLDCVVVESDWPEYEPTWNAIEMRMTGSLKESAVQTATRIMNIELIRERDDLRAALRHEADCVEAAKAEIEALAAKIVEMEHRESDAVMVALDSLDDYIARIEGNDRGACNHINLLRRHLLGTTVGENK